MSADIPASMREYGTPQAAPARVLFLDFDGVLNSHRTAIAFSGVSWAGSGGIRAKMDEVAVRLVGGIVRRAGAGVVLSTSWRTHPDWKTYGPALDLPVIDRTPDLHGPRGADIAAWLAVHPEVERYAIVDDDADMLPEQLPYFVKTEHADGLTFAAATKLAELLGIAIYDVNHPAQRLPEPTKTLDWNAIPTGGTAP